MDSKKVYSTKTEKYAKYRWDYAAGAIEAIIEMTQLSYQSTLADIGAGSGILTKHFVEKVQKIYAIEPNKEFREILSRNMGALPSVSVIDGSAESTHLPSMCVDVITVAQAIHWFDPEPARREMMRILKNDGWLVLLRNGATNSEQNEVISSLMTDEFGADFTVVHELPKEKPIQFYFGNGHFNELIFPFQFNQNWEEFIGALTTASYMPDEDHPLFDKLERKAREIFFQLSKDGLLKVQGETELIIGQPSM